MVRGGHRVGSQDGVSVEIRAKNTCHDQLYKFPRRIE